MDTLKIFLYVEILLQKTLNPQIEMINSLLSMWNKLQFRYQHYCLSCGNTSINRGSELFDAGFGNQI